MMYTLEREQTYNQSNDVFKKNILGGIYKMRNLVGSPSKAHEEIVWLEISVKERF